MNIVFAHFLSKPPKYLILNIERTIKLFPQHNIYIITDLNSSNFSIQGLNYYEYKKERNWSILESLLTHDKTFRLNFWFLSVVRFLAIADFMQNIKGEILHIESDVIISRDFPFKLLSESSAKFAFPIVNNYQAIASCLYIKDLTSAIYLRDLTIIEAKRNSKTTDMHILRILTKIKSDSFQILPSAALIYDGLNPNDNSFYEKNNESIAYFKGVFDGVDIGMFLFGQDPRNKRGFSSIRKPTPGAYLDVSKQTLVMSAGRDFPDFYYPDSKKNTPIYTLHIHCKNPDLFNPIRSKRIIRKAVIESINQPRTKFYVYVFIKSVWISFLRRIRLIF